MPKYQLDIATHRTVVVDLPKMEDAYDFGYGIISKDQTLEMVSEADMDERLSTYECQFCGEMDLKENWGPGRVQCPNCKEFAK